jgi:hypothetical protein
LLNGIYRLIVPSPLNALCAAENMKAAVVFRMGGRWEVREVATPEPSAAK